MNLVPGAVSRAVSRQALLGRENSPKLLFGAGVIGMVGSTVLACRATLRLEEVLATTKNDLNTARTLEHFEYSERDRSKDITLIYSRSVIKIGRLYVPSILLGAASIGCLTKSHNILQERNMALTAAYTAVDEAFKSYRARVIDKYGENVDRELRYDSEDVEVLDDKGKTQVVKRASQDNEHSMYARFFDEYSPSWSKEPEYNYVFLRCQQNWANDLLRARGHLFLNEVYDMLGIGRSRAGSVVGWLIGDEGDCQVDFGIFDPDNESARDFVNGREGSILLDFNVDGVIYDKIREHGERLRWQS